MDDNWDYTNQNESSYYRHYNSYTNNNYEDDYNYHSRRRGRGRSRFRLLKFFLLFVLILILARFIKDDEAKKIRVKPVDPNTVTEQQKLNGFTTERITAHFNKLINSYFPDDKEAFEGWQIIYKKNEEWNKTTWKTVDGKTSTGHYEAICDYGAKTIFLNDDYFPRYDSHDTTILHEMIHVVTAGESHQGKFLTECKRISQISGYSVDEIYGYNGFGSVK